MIRNASMSRRAFTIAELLIAGVVAAIVLGVVAVSLDQVVRARATSRVRLSAHQRASAALERIRKEVATTLRSDDLYQARVLLVDDSTSTPIGELDRDELLLFNVRLNPVRQTEYHGDGLEHESQLRVEDDAAGSALWLRTDPVPDDVPDGGGVATPVMEGIIGLKVEAYDGENWYEEWDSDELGIPWALRLTVTAAGDPDGTNYFEDSRELLSLRTVVPLDRVEPPYTPPVPEEDPAAAADAAAAAAAAAGGAAGGGGFAGIPVGGGGRGGGTGGGRPGGGGMGSAGGTSRSPGGRGPGGRGPGGRGGSGSVPGVGTQRGPGGGGL